MKKINIASLISILSILTLAIIIISGCKKDDDGEENPPAPVVNPLVGTYSFISAIFNEPITVIVNGDTNNYQAGDDASLFVGGGLLGSAPCDNTDNAALNLRADLTSWYVCLGESNELQQGTWEGVNDNTILKLNISIPANFVVNITDINLADNKLQGIIPALPMPYDTSLPVGDPLPSGGINFQVAKVSVVFNREN